MLKTSFSFYTLAPWMTWEYTNVTAWVRLTLNTTYDPTPTRNLGNKINKISKEKLDRILYKFIPSEFSYIRCLNSC